MIATHADKLIKSGHLPIHFVTCKDPEGRDCYYFVMAPHAKMKMLMAVQEGIFNIHDYGKVIASGFGKAPTEAIKKKLKDEYGYEA